MRWKYTQRAGKNPGTVHAKPTGTQITSHEPFRAVATDREAMLSAEILPDPMRRQTHVNLGRDHRSLRLALSGTAARGRASFAPGPGRHNGCI